MNKQLVKVCALCDHTIPYHQIVCFAHKVDLEKYENELWFQELVAAQQKQYEIDMTEQRGDTYLLQLEQKYAKTKSKLTYKNKKDILLLKSKGIGRIKIAKALNLSKYAVDRFLMRNKRKMHTNAL